MKITYYGHSTFMVETAGKSILFDPFIRPNPLATNVDFASIHPDYMLLSHGHEDHVADAPAIANRSECTVVGVYELTTWMAAQGAKNTHGMNIGGAWNFDFGKVKLTPALHSSTLPDGSTGGCPAGFVVSNTEDCFYYAGDTALFTDMGLIAKQFNLKTAFLPIGGNFTMDMYDAVEAAKLLQVKHVIGMHYDTFGYIKIEHEEAKALFAASGIHLELLAIGNSITL
jgi:L-ascorbate metabolism protein UlaG (beta-lactamase superfamily)